MGIDAKHRWILIFYSMFSLDPIPGIESYVKLAIELIWKKVRPTHPPTHPPVHLSGWVGT